MQTYRDFAKKNGVVLVNSGKCQFCGANTKAGVRECVELFNQGFDHLIDFSDPKNYTYKFLSVDAHTLQHPEIHGRWNNHLHLTRLHLMMTYEIKWVYEFTSKLSRHLGVYKRFHEDEYLTPPTMLERGRVTITDVIREATNEETCQLMIERWAGCVYESWSIHHKTVDPIAKQFLK